MSAVHAYPSSQVRGSTVQVRLLLGHQPCSEPQAFRADPRGIVRPRVSPHAARGPGLPFAVVCFGGGSPRGQREGRLIATGRGAADRGCVRVPGPLGTETGRGHRRQAQLLSPRLVCVCAWRRGPSGAGRGCGVSVSGSQPGGVCRAGGTWLEPCRARQGGHSTGLSSSLQSACPSQGPDG